MSFEQTDLPSTTGGGNVPEATAETPKKTRKRRFVDSAKKSAEQKPEAPAEIQPKAWEQPTTKETVVSGFVKIDLPFCLDKRIRPRRRFMSALRELTEKQRFGLNVLLEGMREEAEELENGSAVNSHTNTIRAILEKAADAAAESIK